MSEKRPGRKHFPGRERIRAKELYKEPSSPLLWAQAGAFRRNLFAVENAALALALVLEGLPWALAPGRTRESLRLLLDLPPQALRAGGAALIALGILAAALGICFRS